MELRIGHVVKSHGIKGEVVVEITTDEPELRFAVGTMLTGRQGRKEHTLTIDSVRMHQGRLLVKFKEISDRTAADSLRGTKFFAEPLIDDEGEGFYDHELEGLRVLHDGQDIGVVSGVMHAPNRQILEIELAGGKEALVPFVHDIVPEVDVDEGRLVITPPDGLLEL